MKFLNIALFIVLGVGSCLHAQAQTQGEDQELSAEERKELRVQRYNRFSFAIADGSAIAGAILTLSAKGEVGKRQLGYYLILGGAITFAANQATNYLIFKEFNTTIASRFNRDCRTLSRFPEIEPPVGLASLAEGIDHISGNDTRSKVASTCALYNRVATLSRTSGITSFQAKLAYEAAQQKNLSKSDLRIIKNMFGINGVI